MPACSPGASVSWGSPEEENQRDTEGGGRGDLLWEWDHVIVEAGKSSRSAACKLETQESWWCNLVQVQRPESQGPLEQLMSKVTQSGRKV